MQRMHVLPCPPVRIWRVQLQTDDILENVRRSVDLDMHRPPEGDADGGVVRLVEAGCQSQCVRFCQHDGWVNRGVQLNP